MKFTYTPKVPESNGQLSSSFPNNTLLTYGSQNQDAPIYLKIMDMVYGPLNKNYRPSVINEKLEYHNWFLAPVGSSVTFTQD